MGGAFDAFWHQTPRLLALFVEGKKLQAEAEHHDRAWLALTTAACSRAKKMPTLKELTGKRPAVQRRKVTNPDMMMQIARMWSAVAPPKEGEDPCPTP